jgi:uncharacterized membrane protein
MPFLKKIADRVARTQYGNTALKEEIDLGYFKQPPPPKIIIGLLLLALSYLIGWPAVVLCGILAVYFREPLILVIGGPLTYGLSWAVFGISMLLLGMHSYKGADLILRYMIKIFIKKHSDNSGVD